MTEAALAARVVDYLEDLGWEVFQEVAMGDGVADVVGRLGGRLWTVEVKRSLTLGLVEQADRRRGYSHWSSIAVPRKRRAVRGRAMAEQVLRWRGIGFLEVTPGLDEVRERIPPALNRRALADRVLLAEEQKTFAAAGSPGGRRWSPFRRTCQQIRRVVEARPGIELKPLIEAIEHHYATTSSARSSLRVWLREGKVEGVEARIEAGRLRVYPAPC